MPLVRDLLEKIPVSKDPEENHMGTNIALGAGAGLAGGGLAYALSKLIDAGGNQIAKFRVRKIIEDAEKRKRVITESIDPAIGTDPEQEIVADRMINKNLRNLDRQTNRAGNAIINDQADSLHTSKILRRIMLGALPVAGAGVGYALSKQGNDMTSNEEFAFLAGFTKFAKEIGLNKDQFDELCKLAAEPEKALSYVRKDKAGKAGALAAAIAGLIGGGAGYVAGKSNSEKVAAVADKLLMGLQGASRSGLAQKMMGGGAAAASTAKKYFGPGVSHGVASGMGLPALRAQRAAAAAPGMNLQQRFQARFGRAPGAQAAPAPRPNIQPEFAQDAGQTALVGPSNAQRMQTLNSHWNTMLNSHKPAPGTPVANEGVRSQMQSILNPKLQQPVGV